MKKSKIVTKLLSLGLASIFMLGGLTACGSSSSSKGDDAAATEDESETFAFGADDGTELSMWTFVELHSQFYEEMVNEWNEANPDEKIKLDITVYPYADMNSKLTSSLYAGTGAPDLCDIEVGAFPTFFKGESQFVDLTDYASEYSDDCVQSRLDLYTYDGKLYGIPTHVGATVCFYNTELLESAGIDYTQIQTWDDFKAAGEKLYEATGKYMSSENTSATWTLSLLLAELGSDYTDDNGEPLTNSAEMEQAFTLLKDLQDDNVLGTIPGGTPDCEEAWGELANYGCTIMPFWMSSRYLNYCDDLSGKVAIAACPKMNADDTINSVGGGGTGTVVTKQCAEDKQDLAARFLTWAKLSTDGATQVWNVLGFDPVNTSVWSDTSITENQDNKYIQYFVNNPFEVLLNIQDGIALIKSNSASSEVNGTFCETTLNEVFEDGMDIKEALDEAEDTVNNALQ